MASLRVKLGLLIAGIVIGTMMVSPASAHVTSSVSHMWTDHIKPLALETFYTKSYLNKYFVRATDLVGGTAVNKSSNRVSWKKLKGVPAGLADGIDRGKYGRIIVVAKSGGDYTSPIAAMNSITDASATKHYLVHVAPGVYNLGDKELVIKDYVDLQGAGQNVTTIVSTIPFGEFVPSGIHSTVGLADNSTLSDLTIKNNGDFKHAAISAWQVGSTEDASKGIYSSIVNNVWAEASGDGNIGFAIYNGYSSVKYMNVTAKAYAWNASRGFYATGENPLAISDSTIYAEGDDIVLGFGNDYGSPRISNTTITAAHGRHVLGVGSYISGDANGTLRLEGVKIDVNGQGDTLDLIADIIGIYHVTGDASVVDSEITASGESSADVAGIWSVDGPLSIQGTSIKANDATSTSNGIYLADGQVTVLDSTVSSSQNALNNAVSPDAEQGQFLVSGGGLVGDVSGPVLCSGVFNLTARALLGSNCSP